MRPTKWVHVLMNWGTLAEMRGVITPQRVADAVSTALVGPIYLHNAVVATLAKRINGKGFDAKPGEAIIHQTVRKQAEITVRPMSENLFMLMSR